MSNLNELNQAQLLDWMDFQQAQKTANTKFTAWQRSWELYLKACEHQAHSGEPYPKGLPELKPIETILAPAPKQFPESAETVEEWKEATV